MRRLVNDLLDWRGVPIRLGRGKTHRTTYASIIRALEPINEARGEGDRISYSSLWVHAKRHYDIDGIVAYWSARMPRELRNAMRGSGRRTYRTALGKSH